MADTRETSARAKSLGDYSPRNQLAILTQCPDATQLAGYRQWQALGRQVRKGERGIRICAPVTEKTDDGRRMVNVRGAVVFDISQTDPADPTRAKRGGYRRHGTPRTHAEDLGVGYVRDPGEDAADRWSETHR